VLRRARGRDAQPETDCGGSTTGATGTDAFLGVQNSLDPNTAGGGDSAVLGGGLNQACGGSDAIGGGIYNIAGGDSGSSFLGAGALNYISAYGSFIGAGGWAYVNGNSSGALDLSPGNQVSGEDSFIGTGELNLVSGNGSFIGAGDYLYATTESGGSDPSNPGNQISANDSFIGAGDKNTVAAAESFIGDGGSNDIVSSAMYSVLAGGYGNTLSGEYAAIGGGYGNEATGEYAVVAGGDGNTAAGAFSFAGGYHADAVNNGSFVWSDHKGTTVVKDTAQNQYVVRASGGVYFYSNSTLTSGVSLPSGSGAWSNLSDRNAKTNIVPLDDASILTKVAALPVTSWRYKTESGVRHVGPMAQDFYAAFGVGEDNRHITSIDEDGVALAAIKAVNAKLDRENRGLRNRLAALEAKVDAMSEKK
jgi:hypothetical protein